MTDDPYQRYLDDVGDAVHRAAAASPRARRTPLAVGGALVAATIALIVLIAGAPGRSPVSILDQAQAALTPNGDLLHYVVTTTQVQPNSTLQPPHDPNDSCPQTKGTEVWQTFTPDRWRAIIPPYPRGPRCGGMSTGDGQELRGRTELSWDNGTSTTYTPALNTLLILHGYSHNSPAGDVPTGGHVDFGGGDPVEVIRGLLAKGRLTDQGPTTLNGQAVHVLSGQTSKSANGYNTTTTVRYAIDAKTSAPVRIITTLRVTSAKGPAPRAVPSAQQLDFSHYRREPLTSQSARSLVVRPVGNPKTTDQSASEYETDARKDASHVIREAPSDLRQHHR